LPADPNWDVVTIAKSLRDIQMELGSPTHVHGLYVIGIGVFSTIPVEHHSPAELHPAIIFLTARRLQFFNRHPFPVTLTRRK
jgi:hypothetical protein